ncbi:MAG TPA: bifunctional riboflavin kinase/FAD synthetase [Thermodesulfobacteriota bacterium]
MPRPFHRAAVALGNFDGVHLGHQALFDRLKALGGRLGGDTVVYTFDPHPVAFFFPDRPPFLLTTLEQRLELIERFGIPTAVVATFDASYAAQSPEAFVEEVLVGALSARAVVVGYDFTFGKGRAGTPEVLVSLGRRHGFEVDVIAPVSVGGEPVSSSRIRRLVAAGRVEEAAALLGRPYAIRGAVVPGHRRGGAALGFPTANVAAENPVLPPNGVYAALVRGLGPDALPAGAWAAAVNVGVAPTFGGAGARTVEAHLLDFDGDLYGRRLEVAFVARLRDERRFPDLDALRAQIAADVAAVRAALAGRPAR